MRNLVLENEFKLPERLTEVLEHQFKEGREVWLRFNQAFWPENEAETKRRLMSLEDGDNVIFETVFAGKWYQFEMMVMLLDKLREQGKRINVYIMVYDLAADIQRWLRRSDSELADEDASDEEVDALKAEMNDRLMKVLEHHNVRQMHGFMRQDPDYCQKHTTRIAAL